MRTSTKIEIVLVTIAAIVAIGTVSYHNLENWNWVDSFYFTGTTMTTVGSDLHPTTPLSKIFTVFFAFGGVGISLFALSLFAAEYFERREQKIEQMMHRKVIRSLRNNFNHKTRRRIVAGSKI